MSSTEFVSTRTKSDTAPSSLQDREKTAERMEPPRQWTLKGLAPETVEVSREAAKRSGMKLNAWVSRALEHAAAPESGLQREESHDTLSAPEHTVQRIKEELLRLRAESNEMRSTVNTMTQILLKLCAQQI
jgi:hypothetical protein